MEKMSSVKKGKNITSKKFFDEEDKMMYEHGWPWSAKEGEKNVGLGDALWRTGLAYITWKDTDIKEGIIGCFRKVKIINSSYSCYIIYFIIINPINIY